MFTLLLIVVGVPIGVWLLLRVRYLEQQVKWLIARGQERSDDLQALEQRVGRLATKVSPEAQAGGEAVTPAGALIPPTAAPVMPREAPDSTTEQGLRGGARESAGGYPPSAGRRPAAGGDWLERLRAQARGGELEALIGGSWLNRLGVLITVIGLALGLGYSFRYLGPAGRVAVSLAVSTAMLAGGVLLERRPVYRTFARGLIGGGWAALYFTTYAMHGLEAAKVIEGPLAGALLLMGVALGMILHSLRYRSQAVTGTAFLVGFATLAITPLSTFAIFASVPLAVAMTYVAHRFRWTGMAAVGVPATYGAYLFSGAAPPTTGSLALDFLRGQAFLLVYWVIFETFDLLRLAGSRAEAKTTATNAARTLSPLNAAAFIGASMLQWSIFPEVMMSWFLTLAAVLFLVSTASRARIRPPSSFPEQMSAGERALDGGYEGAISVAVAMTMLAVLQSYAGLRVNLALLIEGEMLFLGGLFLGQRYLRGLGAAVFLLPLVKLVGVDLWAAGHISVFGLELAAATPIAICTAAVFYLDRALLHSVARRQAEGPSGRGARLLSFERSYTFAASAIVAMILGKELPSSVVEIAWLAMAWLLLELGIGWADKDLRYQGYGVALLGFVSLLVSDVAGLGPGPTRPWMTLAPSLLIAYGGAVRFALLARPFTDAAAAGAERSARDLLLEVELVAGRNVSAVMGTVLATAFVGYAVTAQFVAVGWAALGLGILGVGALLGRRQLWWQSYPLALLTFFRTWLVNLEAVGIADEAASGPTVAIIVVASFYMAQYLTRRRLEAGRLDRFAPAAFSALGSMLLALLLSYHVSGHLLTVAWGLQGVALLLVGFPLRERVLRTSGLAVLSLCILKVFAHDLSELEAPFRILSFIVLGLLLLAVSLLYTRYRERLRKLS
ncbi:MAG: DUF2339 domain-containing protein [Acidobacteriota bacterium]